MARATRARYKVEGGISSCSLQELTAGVTFFQLLGTLSAAMGHSAFMILCPTKDLVVVMSREPHYYNEHN